MITRKSYNITLTTLDPFRIGGKADPLSEAENPVAVVGGRICIPGSSLKGAYRSELEQWLNDSYYDTQQRQWQTNAQSLRPCIPSTRFSPDEQRLVREGRFRPVSCRYPLDDRGRGGGGGSSTGGGTICPACYLLGAQGLVGFISVPFLFTDIRYDELYSARLERTSQTVMRGTNRAYQLVPPGAVFTGELTVLLKDDLLGWELGRPRPLSGVSDAWLGDGTEWNQSSLLQSLVEERIQAIGQLGGYRSKGFGRVRIEVREK